MILIFRKYPALKSSDAESVYRAKYDEDFARFHVLKEQNSKIAAKFEKLQSEMSRFTEGTEPYESIREQVIQEYRQCVKDGYLKNVREYQETHQRNGLTNIFLKLLRDPWVGKTMFYLSIAYWKERELAYDVD